MVRNKKQYKKALLHFAVDPDTLPFKSILFKKHKSWGGIDKYLIEEDEFINNYFYLFDKFYDIYDDKENPLIKGSIENFGLKENHRGIYVKNYTLVGYDTLNILDHRIIKEFSKLVDKYLIVYINDAFETDKDVRNPRYYKIPKNAEHEIDNLFLIRSSYGDYEVFFLADNGSFSFASIDKSYEFQIIVGEESAKKHIADFITSLYDLHKQHDSIEEFEHGEKKLRSQTDDL